MLIWYFVATLAVLFAVHDLWDRHARFTPLFLALTMLGGFVLLILREKEMNQLRWQLVHTIRERDELKAATARGPQ